MSSIRNILLISTFLSIAACVPAYEYTSTSDKDPVLIFGDRFQGGAILSPARTFLINTDNPENCDAFRNLGTVSNHWMWAGDKVKKINVPVDTVVTVKAIYNYSTGSVSGTCNFEPISFVPEDSQTYSIDIFASPIIDTTLEKDYCYISVQLINPDGSHSDEKLPITESAYCKN